MEICFPLRANKNSRLVLNWGSWAQNREKIQDYVLRRDSTYEIGDKWNCCGHFKLQFKGFLKSRVQMNNQTLKLIFVLNYFFRFPNAIRKFQDWEWITFAQKRRTRLVSHSILAFVLKLILFMGYWSKDHPLAFPTLVSTETRCVETEDLEIRINSKVQSSNHYNYSSISIKQKVRNKRGNTKRNTK